MAMHPGLEMGSLLGRHSWIGMLLIGLMVWPGAAQARETPPLIFWNSQQASDVVEQMAADFTRQTGVRVEVSWISQSDYRTTLLRHARDGDLPDVALVAGDYLSLAPELRLSPVPLNLQLPSLLPQARDAGRVGDQMLGAPVVWGNHLMLAWNRRLVSAPPASFASMEQQQAALRQRGVRTLATNFGEMYSFVPFLAAYGGWPLDADGRISLDGDPMRRALDFYFGLAERGLTARECRNACVLERFARGEFAYAIVGDWDVRSLQAQMGDALGLAPLPAIGDAPLVPMFSAYVLAFPGDSLRGPKREQLLRFLHWMQSRAVQERWARETRLFPVHRDVFRAVVRRADANTAASLTQLRRARVMPNERNMSYAWEGMAKGFSALYNGRVDAAGAATLMQRHAERVARRMSD